MKRPVNDFYIFKNDSIKKYILMTLSFWQNDKVFIQTPYFSVV